MITIVLNLKTSGHKSNSFRHNARLCFDRLSIRIQLFAVLLNVLDQELLWDSNAVLDAKAFNLTAVD